MSTTQLFVVFELAKLAHNSSKHKYKQAAGKNAEKARPVGYANASTQEEPKPGRLHPEPIRNVQTAAVSHTRL